MLGYEGKASINEVDQIRQRKGSWPVWIDLQKGGIREIIVLILIYNLIFHICSETCSGNEGSIEECHEPELWAHTGVCDHSEDVVLSCQVT